MKNVFPIGAKVYVDKRDVAIIRAAFPEGSSSYLFPHYKVDFVGGDRGVAVRLDRVGVVKATKRRTSRGRSAAPTPRNHELDAAYYQSQIIDIEDGPNEDGGREEAYPGELKEMREKLHVANQALEALEAKRR